MIFSSFLLRTGVALLARKRLGSAAGSSLFLGRSFFFLRIPPEGGRLCRDAAALTVRSFPLSTDASSQVSSASYPYVASEYADASDSDVYPSASIM
jgi:hypothetical protein